MFFVDVFPSKGESDIIVFVVGKGIWLFDGCLPFWLEGLLLNEHFDFLREIGQGKRLKFHDFAQIRFKDIF